MIVIAGQATGFAMPGKERMKNERALLAKLPVIRLVQRQLLYVADFRRNTAQKANT